MAYGFSEDRSKVSLSLAIPYGECDTAAATAEKTVTVNGDVSLVAGTAVAVKFANTNSIANPTLNVNGLGARPMMRASTAPSTSAASSWNASSIVLFMYDGTNWMLVGWMNTTYSSMTDAQYQAGTAGTAMLITPARLKAAIKYHAPESEGAGSLGDFFATGHLYGGQATEILSGAFSSSSTAPFYYLALYRQLSSVYFPEVITIGSSAFHNRQTLVNAVFPKCETIYSSAFWSCYSLGNISFPMVKSIGEWAFNNCFTNSSMTSVVNMPYLSSVGSAAFYSCKYLSKITIGGPSAQIGSRAFYYCTSLHTVEIPYCQTIFASAFYYCSNLMSLYLTSVSAIPSITTNSTVFYYTPLMNSTYTGSYGSIYVPSSLYASFKTATHWSYYSNRMVSI